MHEIYKMVSLSADGKPMDFRLTKLDAFSGVLLLRMMANLPDSKCHSERSEESFLSFFAALSDADLRSLMTTCLQHAEVLLPAGWMPVMTWGEWTFPELEHDTAVCLKLTIEEITWTLEGFFGERSRTPVPGPRFPDGGMPESG